MRGTFDVAAADIDGAPRGYYPPPRHRVTYRSAVTRLDSRPPPSPIVRPTTTPTAAVRYTLHARFPPSPPLLTLPADDNGHRLAGLSVHYNNTLSATQPLTILSLCYYYYYHTRLEKHCYNVVNNAMFFIHRFANNVTAQHVRRKYHDRFWTIVRHYLHFIS